MLPSRDGVSPLAGYQIIESVTLFVRREQYRFPRSKRRRIRRKWAKRASNWRLGADPSILVDPANGILYMHPQTAARLRSVVRQAG